MESSLAGKPERVGPVEVEDIKRDLLSDFCAVAAQQSGQCESENLQVFLRVRPFTSAESDGGESQDCVTIEGLDTVVLKPPRNIRLPQTAQKFTFTQVFGPDASQRKVFEGSVRGLLRDVLEGGNCLVFTYGVTNAGKTFTFLGPDHDSGLLPRSLAVLFNSIEGRLYCRSDLKPQRCRDFSRLTPDQQTAENHSKKNLLRLFKESDRTLTSGSGRSMFLDGSALSSDSSVNSVSDADSFCLDVNSNVRFSVWVSFCEIYNDNIHDLLEQVPGGHHKRTVLRLSQDVKGNSFIKDLRWVQVNGSDEAYRVMKIGKKNQSFSATRLNQLSSRSHSIFSIRILRVDDAGVPRVLSISELALCDLAGSERCSRTQNTGERLKEAGNINSSLLTLGKCINAMRLNQNAKFQHHIPFRESKLTHFLQFFFCGAGRVSMVVNINQNSSCFDETLNVLKFSALAQKVVVLNSRPTHLDDAPHRSAMELSMIIDEADRRRNVSGRGRKSSLVAWETSLEDVMEDEDGEEEEEEEEDDDSVMEGTVLEAEQKWSDREAAVRLVLEAQIREEVSAEFMELFNKMEKDYSDRLEKEREILEERAEKRVEILKNLVSRTVDMSAVDSGKEEQAVLLEGIISSMTQDLEKIREDAQSVHHCLSQQTHAAELEALRVEKQQTQEQLLEVQQSLEQQRLKESGLMEICQQKDDIINKLQTALDSTVEDAATDRCLVESIRAELLELQQNCRCLKKAGREEEEEKKKKKKRSRDAEEERGVPAKRRVVLEEEIWRLQEENEQKEEAMVQLKQKEEELKEETTRLKQEVEELKEETTRLKQREEELEEETTRLKQEVEETTRLKQEVEETTRLKQEVEELKEETTRLKQEEEEMTRLKQEVEELKEEMTRLKQRKEELKEEMTRLKQREEELKEEMTRLKQEVEELKEETTRLKQEVEELTDLDQCPHCPSVFMSLETQQKETSRLSKDNKALVNGIFQLQTQMTDLQKQLREQTDKSDSLSEQLNTTKTRLHSTESQSEERTRTINSLMQEVEQLKQEVKEEEGRSLSSSGSFHATIEELKKESRAALERSAQKSEQMERLQRQKEELEKKLSERENTCAHLTEELANQKAELTRQLQSLRAELESEGGALRGRLEEMRRQQEEERRELQQVISKKQKQAEDGCRQVEALNTELERLRAELQSCDKEEEKENRAMSVVDELKEELQSLQERRKGRMEEDEEERKRTFEAVKKEVERLTEVESQKRLKEAESQRRHRSPLKSNMADGKKTPRTTARKRKSCEVEGLLFSENKRNRMRNIQKDKQACSALKEKEDAALHKIGELIHSSPSILGGTAKTLMGLVAGRPVDEETVTMATRPKRGRRKLYRSDAAMPMLDSPQEVLRGRLDEKESDHLIIRRQLRSKTCRK